MPKKNYDTRNPLKKAASVILSNAVRNGKIARKPCILCGATHRIHGHHNDYYKPLEVIWLCPKCHAGYHKQLREKERKRLEAMQGL